MTFSSAVSVTGTPRQKLSMGRSHPEKSPPDYPRGGAYYPLGGLRERQRDADADLRLHGEGAGPHPHRPCGVARSRPQRRKISAVVPWSYPRYDVTDVSHDWLRYDARHKVDGGLLSFRSASVDGRTLTVSFTGNLDPGSVPVPTVTAAPSAPNKRPSAPGRLRHAAVAARDGRATASRGFTQQCGSVSSSSKDGGSPSNTNRLTPARAADAAPGAADLSRFPPATDAPAGLPARPRFVALPLPD